MKGQACDVDEVTLRDDNGMSAMGGEGPTAPGMQSGTADVAVGA